MKSPEGIKSVEANSEKSLLKERAREALLVIALGVGGLLRDTKAPQEMTEAERKRPNVRHIETLLDPLKDRYEIKPRIAGEKQIIFAGLVHQRGSLSSMKSAGVTEVILKTERDFDAVIDFARSQGLRAINSEGITKENKEGLDNWRLATNDLRAYIKEGNSRGVSGWISQLMSFRNSLYAHPNTQDDEKAFFDYSFLNGLNEIVSALDVGVLDFDAEPKKAILVLRDSILKEEFMQEDNLFILVGASRIACANGEIDLLVTSSAELDQKTESIYQKLNLNYQQTGKIDLELARQYREAQSEREDFALRQASLNFEQGQTMSLIEMGGGHDFYWNLSQMHTRGEFVDVGLTDLRNKAEKVWSEELIKKHPEQMLIEMTDKNP